MLRDQGHLPHDSHYRTLPYRVHAENHRDNPDDQRGHTMFFIRSREFSIPATPFPSIQQLFQEFEPCLEPRLTKDQLELHRKFVEDLNTAYPGAQQIQTASSAS